MLATSDVLSAIPGLRHAFFTREGGVSDGIYAGLNGGLGSNDIPANVQENRRRMADDYGIAMFGQLRDHFFNELAVILRAHASDGRPDELRLGRDYYG